MLSTSGPGLRKPFGAANGSWHTASSWRWISLRSLEYAWVASGSASGAYYLTRASDGSIPEGLGSGGPAAGAELRAGTTTLAAGTLPTLAAGQWAVGNVDSLPRNTIYVRLAGDADPDTLTVDSLTYRAIPTSSDTVVLDAESGAITGDFSQLMSAYDIYVQPEYARDLGASQTPLLLSVASALYLAGRMTAYVDLRGGVDRIEVYCGRPVSDSGPTVYLDTQAPQVHVSLYRGTLRLGTRSATLLRSLSVFGGEAEAAPTVTCTGTDGRVILRSGALTWQGTLRDVDLDVYGGKCTLRDPATLTSSADHAIILRGPGEVVCATRRPLRKLVQSHVRSTLTFTGGVLASEGLRQELGRLVLVDIRPGDPLPTITIPWRPSLSIRAIPRER